MANEKRLIDANALIDYLKKLDFEGGTKTRNQAGNEVLHIHMPQVIRQAPTVDAVEVVRCKDCKHLVFSDCYGECNKYLRIVRPDDFCSYGERREGE